MDKSTLSQYGWVIICIIIIAILLGLATPFGLFVKDSVMNTVNSFGDKIEEVIPVVQPTPTPNPDEQDFFIGDEVQPNSQQARNIVDKESADSFTGFHDINVSTLEFRTTLGKYSSYEKVDYFDMLPKDFNFKNTIISLRNGNLPSSEHDNLTEFCLQVIELAVDAGIELTDGQAIMFGALGVSSYEELESAILQDGEFNNVDEFFISVCGATYDEVIERMDLIINSYDSTQDFMDQNEAMDLIVEAFDNEELAIDITSASANQGIEKEADAGRVIIYKENDNLIVAGKNGKVIVADADALRYVMLESYQITSIDFNSAVNTKNVTTLDNLLWDNDNIKEINFSGADFSNVSKMNNAFERSAIEKIDFSKSCLTSVVDASSAFENSKLTNINLPKEGLPNLVNANKMFYNCASLCSNGEALDLGWLPSTLANATYMFQNCNSVTQIINFDNKSFPSLTKAKEMLPPKITHLSMKNFDAPNLTEVLELPYLHLNSLIEMDISGLCCPVGALGYGTNGISGSSRTMRKVIANNLKTPNVVNIQYLFNYYWALEDVSLSFEEFPEIVNAYNAFEGCGALTTLDLSGVNLTSVESVNFMFAACRNLTSLKLGDVGNMSLNGSIFKNCNSLKTLEVGNILSQDAAAVISGCISSNYATLENIKIGNISNSSIPSLLYYIPNLKTVEIGNIENISDLSEMFIDLHSLTSVKLGKISDTNNFSNMFAGCESLKNIEIDSIEQKEVQYGGMFGDVVNGVTLKYNNTYDHFLTSPLNLASYDFTYSKIICTDKEITN